MKCAREECCEEIGPEKLGKFCSRVCYFKDYHSRKLGSRNDRRSREIYELFRVVRKDNP